MTQVAVFGFGLIGASLAAALRKAEPTTRVVAIDLARAIALPEARALADELVDQADRARVRAVVERADLCVIAAPVSVIAAELPALLEWAPTITDCGSTKRSICAAVAGSPRIGRFVPGHPMAGAADGGAAQARADLFQGQTWLLCPEKSDADAVARVEWLIQRVGATAARVSLAEHDRAVAFTSHAPQVFASALSVLATRAGATVAAGPAYRATTRSAGGSDSMWRDIFAANADEISAVLRQIAAELVTAAAGLEASPVDATSALELLAQARLIRKS